MPSFLVIFARYIQKTFQMVQKRASERPFEYTLKGFDVYENMEIANAKKNSIAISSTGWFSIHFKGEIFFNMNYLHGVASEMKNLRVNPSHFAVTFTWEDFSHENGECKREKTDYAIVFRDRGEFKKIAKFIKLFEKHRKGEARRLKSEKKEARNV